MNKFIQLLNIIKKEIKDYFISPIGYVFVSVFLVVVGVVFTVDVFADAQADMNNLFRILPFILVIFVPTITMRSWAEELSNETFELLTAQPLEKWTIILGKLLSSWTIILFSLLLTLPIPIFLNIAGNPDNGIILVSYLGIIILSLIFVLMGELISINTENQIVAYIITVLFIFSFYILSESSVLSFSPESLRLVFSSVGIASHYDTFTRGLIDSRDILYFLLVIMTGGIGLNLSFERLRS